MILSKKDIRKPATATTTTRRRRIDESFFCCTEDIIMELYQTKIDEHQETIMIEEIMNGFKLRKKQQQSRAKTSTATRTTKITGKVRARRRCWQEDEEELKQENDHRRQEIRKTRRVVSVSFADSVEIVPGPSPLDQMLHGSNVNSGFVQVKRDLWYGMEELNQFRSEARQLCQQMRASSSSSLLLCNMKKEEEEDHQHRTDKSLRLLIPSDEDDHSHGLEQKEQQLPHICTKRNNKTLNRIGSTPMHFNERNGHNEKDSEEDPEAFSTRGLEQRACLERQRRRYITIKRIVETSQQTKQTEKQV